MNSTTVSKGKIGVENRTAAASPQKYARVVGVLYLLIFFVGPFAFFMGRVGVVVPGDPAATVENLMASQSLFRLGIVAETVIVLVEIVVSALLYVLFRSVSKPLSLAAALARFAQSILQAVNLFTAVPALLLLGRRGLPDRIQPGSVERARTAVCRCKCVHDYHLGIDLRFSLASAWLSGLQVRLYAENSGHPAHDRRGWLSGTELWTHPCAPVRRNPLDGCDRAIDSRRISIHCVPLVERGKR
jgi:hypothetical protein